MTLSTLPILASALRGARLVPPLPSLLSRSPPYRNTTSTASLPDTGGKTCAQTVSLRAYLRLRLPFSAYRCKLSAHVALPTGPGELSLRAHFITRALAIVLPTTRFTSARRRCSIANTLSIRGFIAALTFCPRTKRRATAPQRAPLPWLRDARAHCGHIIAMFDGVCKNSSRATGLTRVKRGHPE